MTRRNALLSKSSSTVPFRFSTPESMTASASATIHAVLNKTDQVFNGTGPGAGPDNMGPPAGQKAPGQDVLAKLERAHGGMGYRALLKIGVRMS